MRLLPTYGILIFIGLYIYSAYLYPGGSPADSNSIGFDWSSNLWCNLMAEYAINGERNPARPFALSGVAVLGFSLIIFFFQFTKYFVKSNQMKWIIKISGIIAMAAALFIFTQYHDIMTTILSLSGLVGILAILRVLHLNKMTFFKFYGVLCLLFIGLNNLFYYNTTLHNYLAWIQQLDFVLVLTWTLGLNLKMRHANPI